MTVDHQLWVAAATILAAVYTGYRLLQAQIEARVSKDTCRECRELTKLQDNHLEGRLDRHGQIIEALQADIKSMDRKLSGVVRSLDKMCMQIEVLLAHHGREVSSRMHREEDAGPCTDR